MSTTTWGATVVGVLALLLVVLAGSAVDRNEGAAAAVPKPWEGCLHFTGLDSQGLFEKRAVCGTWIRTSSGHIKLLKERTS